MKKPHLLVAFILGSAILCPRYSLPQTAVQPQAAPKEAASRAADANAERPSARSETNELTDGLLESLLQPPRQPTTKSSSSPTGSENEDLTQIADEPIKAVQQRMLIAAGFLEEKRTDASTQQIQQDIVKRMDALINRLDQPQPEQRPNTQPEQSEQTSQQRQQRSKSQAESEPQVDRPSSKAKSGRQTDGQKQNADAPANRNGPDSGGLLSQSSSDVKVQLADPRAMQQQVWGQLPERVRQQMQSRMVEQFLPSYRDQIEAYYKELAK